MFLNKKNFKKQTKGLHLYIICKFQHRSCSTSEWRCGHQSRILTTSLKWIEFNAENP
jgi:hypothetical protein